MDTKDILAKIEKKVGKPPRTGLLNYFRNESVRKKILAGEKMRLAEKDEINRIYQAEPKIIRDGQVRWAAFVQANGSLYCPGENTSASQVIYSPSGFATANDLHEAARNIFAIKETVPEDPEQRPIARMITDELERALDWKVPKSLSGGFDMVTTVLSIPRAHMPHGILAERIAPILADPETCLSVLIPKDFWEASFKKSWEHRAVKRQQDFQHERKQAVLERQREAEKLKQTHFESPPVHVTAAAVAELATRLAASNAPADTPVRLTAEPSTIGEQGYGMFLDDKPSRGDKDFEFSEEGLAFVVDYESLVNLVGVTLDWSEEQRGFKFLEPGEN